MSTDTVQDKQEAVAEEPAAETAAPVTVRLKPELVAKFGAMAQGKRASPAKFAEAAALALMEGLAEGGIMISAKKLEFLRKLLNKPITSAEGLLDAIESTPAALPENSFVYTVDPSYRTPIEQEICVAQSRTFEQVMQDVIDTCLINGWAYELRPEGGQIPMTAEERAAIGALTGEDRPTAAGVLKALARRK